MASLVRVRWLVGVLLIAGAALFAVGSSAERHNDQHPEAANEKVLGINLESTPLVVVAVIISLVLAVATWRSNTKLIVLISAAFAAVFAALDIVELVHQIDRSAPRLAVLAAVIAVIHAGAAVLAAQRGTAGTALAA